MYDPDKFRDKAARSKPLQARGKERVRVILASALELFQQQGMEGVTTNDIAEHAHIPIGSLYRYYPNKDSIIAALTELYVDDISGIFEQVAKHPMLPYLSWEEVLLLLVDGWVNYSRLNGPFAFLYVERASPRLHAQNARAWEKFTKAFSEVLVRRCSQLGDRQILICFNLCLAAAEMGISEAQRQHGGDDMHHEAITIIAAYLAQFCEDHKHLAPTS